jgi:hemoglobin
MKRKLFATLLLGFAIAGGAPREIFAAPQQGSSASDTLYKRLGGYDALAAVTDDFLARLVADPQMAKFFVGLNDESKKRVRQHVIDFLCANTGGPCLYLGQDMKAAHKGLHITEAEWNASAADLTATLDKFKVPAKEKGEVLAAIGGLKDQIVGQ